MLKGAKGKIIAQAMDGLVKLGEAFGADRLVDIQYAHIDGGFSFMDTHYDYFRELADTGARVVVPTTTNVGCADMEKWKRTGVPERIARKQLAIAALHGKMGIVATNSCVPYLMGYVPPPRSHLACVESAAVIYFNSVLGCRVNRCGQMAIYSAITGKYPLMGYHLDSHRKGTHLVNVKARLCSSTDWGALGFAVGGIVGEGVPVFTGLPKPTLEDLIALGAALTTSGTVSLFHIPACTPEARTVDEAFDGRRPVDQLVMTSKDVTQVYERFSLGERERVDFLHLGCPNYTIEQVRKAATYLSGKKIQRGITCWICTTPAARVIAERMGYARAIESAGGGLITDTCPLLSHYRLDVVERFGLKTTLRVMMTDSVKQAKYATDLLGCKVFLGKMEDVLKAAVKGRFE